MTAVFKKIIKKESVQLLHDVEHHSGSLTWSKECDYIYQIVATLLLTVPLIIKAIICDKYETYMYWMNSLCKSSKFSRKAGFILIFFCIRRLVNPTNQ